MLDSLVRVSRRVGWGANRFATDPGRRYGRDPHARTAERSGRTGDSPSKSGSPNGRGTRALTRRPARRCSSVTQPANTFPVCNTGPGASPGQLPSGEASGGRGNRSWRSPRGKCTDGTAAATPGTHALRACRRRRTAPTPTAEFRGSTLWSHPFASKRFHVLLNSLFKVLFNFPSRYLFAIGLTGIFSLGWSIPPV